MATTSIFTCVFYLWLAVIGVSLTDVKAGCGCPSMDGCIRPRTHPAKEVFVVTNGGSDFKKWSWDSFTSVLATSDNMDKDVMCYAHQKQKKYGFMVEMVAEDPFDATNSKTEKWIAETVKRRDDSVADMVAVNLVYTLAKLENDSDVQQFQTILSNLKKSLTKTIHKSLPIELICIVPWKPPCVGDNCKITESTLYHLCDLILLDATSFETFHNGAACKARATVPFSHLALGVDEYMSDGIAENRIILGVPWHGFKYDCWQFNYEGKQDSPCFFNKTMENNKPVCDVKKWRTQISIGQMLDQYSEDVPKSHWSEVFQAPVFTHYNKESKQYYQVWYENIMSLRLKYQYAHDFQLKGIALYYAEDLSNKTNPPNKGFTGAMWDWVLHGIIHTTVQQPPPPQYHAGVVAGAAVGCLLLGLAIGVILTCLALRSRVKRPSPGLPFKRDQIEYHDDEDALHL